MNRREAVSFNARLNKGRSAAAVGWRPNVAMASPLSNPAPTLTGSEVEAVLGAITKAKYRAAVLVAYGGGLRVWETWPAASGGHRRQGDGDPCA